MGSVFLTLSVTVERYYSVCHPLRPFRAKKLLLPLAILISVAYNVPKFFEFERKWVEHDDGTHDLVIESTPLRRDKWYTILYVFGSKFVLVEVVPYIILVVLNSLIWLRVKHLIRMRTECGIDSGRSQHLLSRVTMSWINVFRVEKLYNSKLKVVLILSGKEQQKHKGHYKNLA